MLMQACLRTSASLPQAAPCLRTTRSTRIGYRRLSTTRTSHQDNITSRRGRSPAVRWIGGHPSPKQTSRARWMHAAKQSDLHDRHADTENDRGLSGQGTAVVNNDQSSHYTQDEEGQRCQERIMLEEVGDTLSLLLDNASRPTAASIVSGSKDDNQASRESVRSHDPSMQSLLLDLQTRISSLMQAYAPEQEQSSPPHQLLGEERSTAVGGDGQRDTRTVLAVQQQFLPALQRYSPDQLPLSNLPLPQQESEPVKAERHFYRVGERSGQGKYQVREKGIIYRPLLSLKEAVNRRPAPVPELPDAASQDRRLQASELSGQRSDLIALANSEEANPAYRQYENFWRTAYEKIYDNRMKELKGHATDSASAQSVMSAIQLSEQAQSWIADFAQGISSGQDRESPLYMWMQCVFWLMIHKSGQELLNFLDTTYTQLTLPGHWISGCLQYLAFDAANSRDRTMRRSYTLRIHDSFKRLAVRPSGSSLTFTSSFVRLQMQNLNASEIHQMLDTIYSQKVQLHWATMLHVARFYADQNDMQAASNALLDSLRSGGTFKYSHIRMTTAYILRKTIANPNGFELCMSLCQDLHELGMPPNPTMMNVILLNAMDAGRQEIVRAFFAGMFSGRVKPDAYTVAIMLKSFSKNPGSEDDLASIVRLVLANKEFKNNSVITLQLLDCMVKLNMQEPCRETWSKIVDLHNRLFSPEILVRLGFPVEQTIHETGEFASSSSTLDMATVIMLQAYVQLKKLALEGRVEDVPDRVALHDIYKRWKALAQAGIEPYVRLEANEDVYCGFLRGFCLTHGELMHATELMKEMQTPHPETWPVQKPVPSAKVWNTYLIGFQQHGLTRLAEQIMQRMERGGIEVNSKAWQYLAMGYGQEQDMEKFLNALRQIEQDGAAWNYFMSKGLFSFTDVEQLAAARDTMLGNQELDFSGEFRKRIEARIAELGS